MKVKRFTALLFAILTLVSANDVTASPSATTQPANHRSFAFNEISEAPAIVWAHSPQFDFATHEATQKSPATQSKDQLAGLFGFGKKKRQPGFWEKASKLPGWKRRPRRTGTLTPKRQAGPPPTLLQRLSTLWPFRR